MPVPQVIAFDLLMIVFGISLIIRLRTGDPARSHADSAVKPQVLPWYVAGFLLTGLTVTLAGYLPDATRAFISAGTKALVQPANLLIGTSMAAIGLQVDFAMLRKHGPKLMLFAGGAWLILFLVVFALCLVWQ